MLGQTKKKKTSDSTDGGKGMSSSNIEDVHSGCEQMEMEDEERIKDDSGVSALDNWIDRGTLY